MLRRFFSHHLRKFNILHGETIVDRKSKFQAHLAEISSKACIIDLLKEIEETTPRTSKASHWIYAYRVKGTNNNIIESGFEDGGEPPSGRKILLLMEMSNIDNLCVVVNRWYGGIPLGNDRFRHIVGCAKDLMIEHNYIPTAKSKKK